MHAPRHLTSLIEFGGVSPYDQDVDEDVDEDIDEDVDKSGERRFYCLAHTKVALFAKR